MKIIIEKHPDGYCGYPLGFSDGAIVGQGKTYFEALQSTNDAIQVFVDYYGIEKFREHFQSDNMIEDAFIAEAGVIQ